MLPESIVLRAEAHINMGVEVIEAIKLAFQEEEDMIYSLLGGSGNLSKTGNEVAKVLCEKVYNKLSK